MLRQIHKAGEKLFTDFAGDTVPITDRETGEITSAYLFVASLGASNYIYARAVADMQEPPWIGLHVRAFEYLGGVPELVICDNTRTAVTKADRYEPTLHPLFADMAEHYDTVVLPAAPTYLPRGAIGRPAPRKHQPRVSPIPGLHRDKFNGGTLSCPSRRNYL